MNVACISKDSTLFGKLKGIPNFKKVSLISDYSESDSELQNYDVFVISDRIISYEALPDIRQLIQNASVFFMLSNSSNYRLFQKIETICHAHDIHIVYPKQTPEQIVSIVAGILKPQENITKNHVTTFVGAQSRVGVTSSVMAIATRLGMTTEAKIGVLGLNSWNPGTVYIKNYSGAFLDELKTMLSNNMLSSSQLMKEMHHYNHFYYLAGNRDIKKRLHYSIKEIHYLIEQAKKIYDLVLIDAGCNFDDALCIQGLLNSDAKFLVVNQHLSGLESWNNAYEQILEPIGLARSDFLLIVNQYSGKLLFPDVKQIAHDYGVPCLSRISNVGDLGLTAETNQNLIVDYDEPEYLKDINFIVKALFKTYELKAKKVDSIKKNGFMQRLFR